MMNTPAKHEWKEFVLRIGDYIIMKGKTKPGLRSLYPTKAKGKPLHGIGNQGEKSYPPLVLLNYPPLHWPTSTHMLKLNKAM